MVVKMPNRVRDTKSSKKIIYFMLVMETYGQLMYVAYNFTAVLL